MLTFGYYTKTPLFEAMSPGVSDAAARFEYCGVSYTYLDVLPATLRYGLDTYPRFSVVLYFGKG